MNYQVGTHLYKRNFDCLNCAKTYYFELGSIKKYLAKTNSSGNPIKILINTYGWANE